MMRLLTLAMALAFTVGSISIAQACPSMQNAASKEQQTVATDKAPKSTPIVIPQKAKADS
ncbi:MAG: hypothetical protein ACR2QH_19210 [Geminicoccaceae bacterium]